MYLHFVQVYVNLFECNCLGIHLSVYQNDVKRMMTCIYLQDVIPNKIWSADISQTQANNTKNQKIDLLNVRVMTVSSSPSSTDQFHILML